jgi:tRNA 5-methylaminomethyl-2-thiouridine biosynthesis bifunctional protein
VIFDAVIIGAGLAGSSVAYALAKSGAMVCVVDARGIAAGASGNARALALPFSGRTQQPYASDLLGAVALSATVKQHRTKGFLDGAVLAGEAVQFDVTDRIRSGGHGLFGLSPGGITERTGETALSRGVLCSDAVTLNPAELCRANLVGVRVLHPFPISTVERTAGSWSIRGVAGELRAPNVVFAHGPGVKGTRLTSWLLTERVRGQLVYLPERISLLPALRIPSCYDGYVLPLSEGIQVIGAGYDHHSWDTSFHQGQAREIVARLGKWFVISRKIEDRHLFSGRVSFRVSTHDRKPYVGQLVDYEMFRKEAHRIIRTPRPARKEKDFLENLPKLPGLYVSVGHGSKGLLSCNSGAQIIQAAITGGRLPDGYEEVLSEFSPDRLLRGLFYDLKGSFRRNRVEETER